MADDVKVLITEKNGVELEFQEELALEAQNVVFDPTGTPFSSTDVQGALEEISDIDIETLTEFESFSSPTNEGTTSNGWVTKSGYPYTTTVKTTGKYIIDFTAVLQQSANNKQVGFRVQYRIGTTGTWLDLFENNYYFSRSGAQGISTSFREIELLSDSQFQIRLQWGQTNNGGTGYIEEANIKIGKVA